MEADNACAVLSAAPAPAMDNLVIGPHPESRKGALNIVAEQHCIGPVRRKHRFGAVWEARVGASPYSILKCRRYTDGSVRGPASRTRI